MRDYDIRVVLRAKLQADHEDDPGTLIIEEFGLQQGEVRADIAVINGTIHGFEIKSERDTLERLPHQRDAYEQCFDAITLVVGPKHLKAATATIPNGWGILLARDTGAAVELDVIREAETNSRIQPRSIVQLLWRDEALQVLADLGKEQGFRTKRRKELWDALVSFLEPEELRRVVREKIKARGDWRPARRRARGNGSSPIVATAEDSLANLNWLISHRFPNPPN